MLKWIADTFKYWFGGMKFHQDQVSTPLVLVWDELNKKKPAPLEPHKPTPPAGPKQFLEDKYIVTVQKRQQVK